MKLLVTGGAGYIGAHVVRLAEQAGHEVVVVDNFSTGLSQRVQCEVVSLQLASPDAQSELSALMQKHRFDAVIHLAARKQVGESVEIPEQYFLDNLGGLGNLLIAMRENDLHKLVFSSSAATYGIPDVETVSEDYPGKPINPYGQTKLIGEWMVANAAVWGLKGVNLRYFNVAGCEFPDLADTAELNLIPIAIAQLKRGDNPIVFGDDYPTPDGSCIRDYVHVGDLARAHLMAVDYLDADTREYATFNVGSGSGASVLEVLDALKSASRIDFVPEIKARRAGDPPRLVADTTRIEKVFGFKAEHDLEQIVSSAWDAANN
ncbi:MAG: UDP-glucose 4-epimerase GalE [Micrococcales bacterium]|nr:UDP-glucose 4-epimerase GalE [Micrococcales bacterium]MBT5431507.1 UDP-glucose 4-epimerase GalE [Micrococcales bacterium]